MTAALVGQVSIGQVVPTTASLVAQSVVELQAKLAGIVEIQARMAITPPSLSLGLTAAQNLVAAIQAQLALQATLGVELPSIQVDLTTMLAVAADIAASLDALLALTVTLGTAGVYVLTHQGDAPTFGPEMQAVVDNIAPPGNNVHSVTYLATAPAVFEALGAVILTG